MKKRITALLAFTAVLLGLFGCDAILDGEMITSAPHEKPIVTPSDSIIEASTFDELKAHILEFIWDYEDRGTVRVTGYDGDIVTEAQTACDEIMADVAIGAYAVADLKAEVTQIVSYHEVEVYILYKNDITEDRINSIITVPTTRYLKTNLQDMISEYEPSITIQTKSVVLTEKDALDYVSEIYYSNPIEIVMMPVTTVDFFPSQGKEGIIEFTFVYRYKPSTLKAMEISLKKNVQNIAGRVTGGSSDGAILLSLTHRLMEASEYDSDMTAAGLYTEQNNAATAYGALIEGSAVGEGYAMAFKALCDELDIECYVVLGQLDGLRHAWNIVELEYHYYHIDVSMCDMNGIASSFLLSDTGMEKNYSWDTTRYKTCNGPLVYTSNGEIISADTSAHATDS